MKFTPRVLRDNVNISHVSPLRELLVLVGGILGVLFLIYLVLGFALDIAVDKIPIELEQKIGRYFYEKFKIPKGDDPVQIKTQALLDDLVANLDQKRYPFTVHIIPGAENNALAWPGGHILVFEGLLKKVETENELAMVLAHELGHYAHRDHLRGLGRGLVLTLISAITLGADSSATEFFMRMLMTTDRSFSRSQELAADKFGLELLDKKYGHIGGAVDYFKRPSDLEKFHRFLKHFSTHPLNEERVRLLEKEIREKGYKVRETRSLDPVYKKIESISK